MARVQTEAQMQFFEKNGYTHYVFIAREAPAIIAHRLMERFSQ